VLEEQQRDLEEAVLSQREEGLEVVCTQLFIQRCLVTLIGNVVLREGKAVNWVECGVEWSGVAWPIIVCVDLLVVVFANIDRVLSDESVVMNADVGRTCS
jgi:hypothetical protein